MGCVKNILSSVQLLSPTPGFFVRSLIAKTCQPNLSVVDLQFISVIADITQIRRENYYDHKLLSRYSF